jgi:hypothetical protein
MRVSSAVTAIRQRTHDTSCENITTAQQVSSQIPPLRILCACRPFHDCILLLLPSTAMHRKPHPRSPAPQHLPASPTLPTHPSTCHTYLYDQKLILYPPFRPAPPRRHRRAAPAAHLTPISAACPANRDVQLIYLLQSEWPVIACSVIVARRACHAVVSRMPRWSRDLRRRADRDRGRCTEHRESVYAVS